ncbi:hypothetical protein K0M31_015003, partial [Melipona bicolor]
RVWERKERKRGKEEESYLADTSVRSWKLVRNPFGSAQLALAGLPREQPSREILFGLLYIQVGVRAVETTPPPSPKEMFKCPAREMERGLGLCRDLICESAEEFFTIPTGDTA